MSITLMAYPMAFLIAPEEAKKEKIKRAADDIQVNETVANENLRSIRVLTNLELAEIKAFMESFSSVQLKPNVYVLQNGLKIEWQTRGKYCVATLFGIEDANNLQAYGEEYFQYLDEAAMRNVRLIESNEFFYYNYDTSYVKMKDIYAKLKQEGAKNIYATSETEIIANVNGQNIKYYKPENEASFVLEVEQKVTILNIGVRGDVQGMNITYGNLTDLKIQTNIKPEELKQILKKSKYLLFEGNMQTPLKNSNATLNWVLKDGYYRAEFSGLNNTAIAKEAEIIFRQMNVAAGRDLRLINEQSTIVYTYNTNYTDKGMLMNTLVEHGATEIAETGEEVSCKLFGMEMIYYKKDSNGAYTLDITQVSDKCECEDVINDLNEEYGLNIQEMTYNKIKERLDQENMRLESETVLDDNSIILTIDV